MKFLPLIVTGLLSLQVLCVGAQSYPTKPVRIIVPFSPGGSSDGTARPIAEKLTQLLGQSFVIDNRPGAYGTLGAAMVAKADPDGYTLLLMPGTHVLTPRLMSSLPYHAINDFTPVSTLVFAPYVITGAKNQAFSNLREMAQNAKDNPGLAIGNSEVTTRLAAEALSLAANVKFTHVTYKGGGPITNDVLGGHLPIGVATPIAVIAFHKDKRLNALAVTSPKRLPSMPDVPTVAEALGIPQFDSQTWFALAGPANMPKSVVDRLHKAIAQIMADRELKDRMLSMGLIPAEDTSPESMAGLLRSFSERNIALIEAAKLKLE